MRPSSRQSPGAALRAALEVRFRDWSRNSARLVLTDASDEDLDVAARRAGCYYGSRADAVARGEPVTVAAWELPRDALPNVQGILAPPHPQFYVVEPDGRIRSDVEAAA